MSTTTQLRLANDIAMQFHHLPHDQAVAGVVTHIRTFWDPRMRRQLFEVVDAGSPGLDPIVTEAAAALRT